jgi:YhgE/Pip-like protein
VSAGSSSAARRGTADPRLPVRAGQLLRVRAVWVVPLALASVVVAIMTTLYIGAVVNPLAHLHGLPVAVVNRDQGATVGSRRLDIGQQVQAGLLASPAVSGRLHLEVTTLPKAKRSMDSDGLYATLVIPPDFTKNLLYVAGLGGPSPFPGTAPRVEILTNVRAGTQGASLATGILQPALAVASRRIGRHLAALVPARSLTGATRVLLANPITVTATPYRPLPAGTALGLSDFYVALLTLMCGFLGAAIVNSVVDAALGYATSEIGPRWRQRKPVPINRWQTLLIKWAIIPVLTAVLTAVMLAIAVGGLGMDAPYPGVLWLYTWLCATSVGAGTITLFAVGGSFGQLVGLLLFVYAGLASAGGTVPLEALPGVLRTLSYVEPLRQVLAGTRSILYFRAQADAGLTRGTLAASLGLLFWLIVGTVIVTWYDRMHFYRVQPDLLAYVEKSVEGYKAGHAASAPAPSDAGQPADDESARGRPGQQGDSPPPGQDRGQPEDGADGPRP